MKVSTAVLWALVVTGCGFDHSARADSTSGDLNHLVMSSQWKDRSQALEILKGQGVVTSSQRDIDVKYAITILTEETASIQGVRSITEERSEYFADLIDYVASLKDGRVIDALLDPFVLATGDMAASGVAVLGDTAFPSTLNAYQISSNNVDYRVSLMQVFRDMASDGNLNDTNRLNLRTVALGAVGDNDPFVRMGAIQCLAYFPNDDEAQRAINLIAISDDYAVQDNGKTNYPVRMSAQDVLNLWKSK